MFTVKSYSEVKPGDVLKVSGQAVRVISITPRESGGWQVDAEDEDHDSFNFTQSIDRFVKCLNWSAEDWYAFCNDDLESFNR